MFGVVLCKLIAKGMLLIVNTVHIIADKTCSFWHNEQSLMSIFNMFMILATKVIKPKLCHCITTFGSPKNLSVNRKEKTLFFLENMNNIKNCFLQWMFFFNVHKEPLLNFHNTIFN